MKVVGQGDEGKGDWGGGGNRDERIGLLLRSDNLN